MAKRKTKPTAAEQIKVLSDSILQLAKRLAELEEAVRALRVFPPSYPEPRRRIIPMTPRDDFYPPGKPDWPQTPDKPRYPRPRFDEPYLMVEHRESE